MASITAMNNSALIGSPCFTPRRTEKSRLQARTFSNWWKFRGSSGKSNIIGLQVLRYEEGQGYDDHLDIFHTGGKWPSVDYDSTRPDGTNRFATVFMYCKDPEEGGQTGFFKAQNGGYSTRDFPNTWATREAELRRMGEAVNLTQTWEWTLVKD